MKENIFPLQNSDGGFGPSNIIEPLTTSEVLLMAKRLGVEYPNLQKLMAEIEERFVTNGWMMFFDSNINNSSYIYTYFALEIAEFSGYQKYNKEKIENYLRHIFTKSNKSGTAKLSEIYYAIKALKVIGGTLDKDEVKNIKELVTSFQITTKISGSNPGNEAFYIFRISQEAGFDLPDDIKSNILSYAKDYKKMLFSDSIDRIPQSIYYLWGMIENDNSILTKAEVNEYLKATYDEVSGGYNALILLSQTMSEEGGLTKPLFKPHPEIYQTYIALELLTVTGQEIADSPKILNFVLKCRQKYGFSRSWNLVDSNMLTTFAGLMILKYL